MAYPPRPDLGSVEVISLKQNPQRFLRMSLTPENPLKPSELTVNSLQLTSLPALASKLLVVHDFCNSYSPPAYSSFTLRFMPRST